ncbi:DMT family transporter [Pseudaestuariivita atlantica]|uniref:Membrane protein n=1 Tax=Pseudaestuariivita atlantica TaxID=1317121 RepID=A0A0L1JTR4_9RHOB|nr:DMT family transporter [Pseudaestuariivita atlantica]KNG95077.1 membrane protein [Pseudaestuariivita atlantica]
MRTVLLTGLTMIAFAANSLLNRAALADDLIDPIGFGVMRLIAGTLMLAVLILLRRKGWALFTGARIVGVLSLFTYIFGFSVAYVSLDAGFGALILFGTVQITMFGAALAGREPLPPRRILGAGLAMLGLVWLMWPGGSGIGGTSLLHAGMMVAAGIGWGIYSLVGRMVRDPLGDTGANFLGAALLALALVPFLPVAPDAIIASPNGIWLAVVSGALTSGLGYALWYHVLPRLGAARAALAQLTVPVIALVAGVVFLGESVTLPLLAAAALVLAGVAMGIRDARR